ncbi:unnamed protein product [Parnassius apollo]|uniref:(apollo) hypothetical protein n=1 Tax=Parnassius apollo TaxID=110799 RepID=A0A8S3X9F6_PARAO|nr:unnamed protein product [Parnassius apollo]
MAASRKKWTERDTVRFVELYEEEQVLWNVRLKDYKNKDARNAAIQRIIHNLNMEVTIKEVNTKINNIRSTYTQEKVKIKKSTGTGSGANDVYVPSLAWYEIADRFLSGVIKSRKTYQNVENSDNSSSDPDVPAAPSPDIPAAPSPDIPPAPSPDIPIAPSPDIPIAPSPDILAEPSSDIPGPLPPPADLQTPSSSQQLNSEIFVKPQNTIKKKRPLKRPLVPQHIEKSIETLNSIKDQVLCHKEIEDEFSLFAKNIASQLRQLLLIDALDVLSEIIEIVKRKSINRMQLENNSATSNEYTFEIPEHLFNNLESQIHIQRDATRQESSQLVVVNDALQEEGIEV